MADFNNLYLSQSDREAIAAEKWGDISEDGRKQIQAAYETHQKRVDVYNASVEKNPNLRFMMQNPDIPSGVTPEGDTSDIPKLPSEDNGYGEIAKSLALKGGFSTAGGIAGLAGGPISPVTIPAGAALGSLIGSVLDQETRPGYDVNAPNFGLKKGETAVDTVLGAIPGSSVAKPGIMPILMAAAKEGGKSVIAQEVQNRMDNGEPLTAKERLIALALGSIGGGVSQKLHQRATASSPEVAAAMTNAAELANKDKAERELMVRFLESGGKIPKSAAGVGGLNERVLESIAGAGTQQLSKDASAHNVPMVLNKLARKEIDLPRGTSLGYDDIETALANQKPVYQRFDNMLDKTTDNPTMAKNLSGLSEESSKALSEYKTAKQTVADINNDLSPQSTHPQKELRRKDLAAAEAARDAASERLKVFAASADDPVMAENVAGLYRARKAVAQIEKEASDAGYNPQRLSEIAPAEYATAPNKSNAAPDNMLPRKVVNDGDTMAAKWQEAKAAERMYSDEVAKQMAQKKSIPLWDQLQHADDVYQKAMTLRGNIEGGRKNLVASRMAQDYASGDLRGGLEELGAYSSGLGKYLQPPSGMGPPVSGIRGLMTTDALAEAAMNARPEGMIKTGVINSTGFLRDRLLSEKNMAELLAELKKRNANPNVMKHYETPKIASSPSTSVIANTMKYLSVSDLMRKKREEEQANIDAQQRAISLSSR